MSEFSGTTIAERFGDLDDPRVQQLVRHRLLDILTIAICGVICGAESWVGIEEFGKAKQAWFETFLELPHGIPSHDTFGDVFGALDPVQFQSAFLGWIRAISEVTKGQVIAVGGKTLRRSHDRTAGQVAHHMVSAWATANRLILGQVKVEDKSNEITAIPELLRLLSIEGCIVTIDAMGCQRDIAQQIIDQGADYVPAVKANQERMLEDLTGFFTHAEQLSYRGVEHDCHRTVEKGHGRNEIRQCWVISDQD